MSYIFEISNAEGESIKLSYVPKVELCTLIPLTPKPYNWEKQVEASVDIRTYDKDTYKTISGYTLDRVNFYGVVLYKVNDRAFSSLDQAFRYALSLLTGDEFHENEF